MANLSDVDFSFIRYANVWEDADNLLQALAVPEGGRIFSIASGGDNALALLLKNPRQLVVADVSHVQLYVTELKIRAIEQLCHAETLAFLGFRESGDRINCLSRIKPFLTLPCAAYFTANSDLIRDGIIHAGKFERYFSLFRRYVLPLTQPEKNIEGLLRLKSPAEQRRFYAQYWDNWRWRLLFKVFFSRFVMGRLGRDPKFYAQAGIWHRQVARQTNSCITFSPGDLAPDCRCICAGKISRPSRNDCL